MVFKYIEKNKFGYDTWKIKIDNLFHILIFGTDNSSFLVEFKEWKWISSKIHFTYITQKNLEMTICEVFEKVLTFFENQNEYIWTENQKNQKLALVLEEFQISGDILNSKQKKESFNFFNVEEAFRTDVSGIETFTFIEGTAEEALDQASSYLMHGQLKLAIKGLERFTEINGDDLSILIMLARFKILDNNKIDLKILVIKILSIMKNNIGLIPQVVMDEFNIVMKKFEKM